jgi:tetratricopeptide (TPR) repeat protein
MPAINPARRPAAFCSISHKNPQVLFATFLFAWPLRLITRTRVVVGHARPQFFTFLFATLLFAQDPTAQGIAEFHQGRYAAAKATLEQALKQKPADAHARTFLALSRAATGECDAVTGELANLFAGNTRATLGRLSGLALAQCHLAHNRVQAALPVVLQLQKQFPDDADVLYQAARVHMKAWNEVVFRMYQKTPASYRVNQISAEIFEVQGRYPEAAAEYRKAIGKNPSAVNLHFRLGRALLMQSHSVDALREARHEFEAELKLNPGDAAAEYEVGQILLTENKPEEAMARFERALALAPDFTEALLALAKERANRKHYDDAIQFLERAVHLQPANESAHYNLMLAYRNAGRAADALREKAEIDKLQRPPAGEFTEFLEKLGEKAPPQ